MSSRIADVPVPPRCNEMIRSGALVAISSSGGKDSHCMTILLSRIVPREQLLVIHAPLGEVEWPSTIQHIEATLPAGVPLVCNGKRTFRYMKAIGTQPVCPLCHGAGIAPEVAARLDALYPEDRARGFEVGDIRGAFSITQPAP